MLKRTLSGDGFLTITTTQDLSAAILDYTTVLELDFVIEQILVHASTGLTETVYAQFDSINGSNYDTLIGAVDFDGAQDVGMIGGDNLLRALCAGGDQVRVYSAGLASSGTVYVTIKYKPIQ